MIGMARIGFGLSRSELPLTVKSVLDEADKAEIVATVLQSSKTICQVLGGCTHFIADIPIELSTRVPEKFGF